MEELSYKLEVFEGPMELLMHLISKHKININDIPILQLVEQYLEYVKAMEAADMEIASEFIEMAARLIYIKTVSLLPVYEDEAQQLKKELEGDLLEYRDCKIIAAKLAEMADMNKFSRPQQVIPVDMKYRRLHEPVEILNAYIAAIGRGKKSLPPPFESFTEIVTKNVVPIASRVKFIVDKLFKQKRQKLLSFFNESKSKSEIVATFLALLSLTKDQRILLTGDGADTEVEMISDDFDVDVEEDYIE